MSGTIQLGGWMRRWLGAVALAGVMIPQPAAAGPKVDAVFLANGDRLTCEIDKMQQSSLAISTDPLDRVVVHWGTVVGVTSPREFEVVAQWGDRYYGTLARSAVPYEVVVVAGGATVVTLKMVEVISLVPIGRSLWKRIDGGVDVGFSFAQANLETHWTLNGNATYRSRQWLMASSLASQITAREDADKTSRNTLSLSVNRIFGSLWFATAIGQLQQNEELDLNFRTVSGGGVGKILSQASTRSITLFVGEVYTRERFTDQPVDNSAEFAVGGQVNFFTAANDHFSLTNGVVSYYTASRVRVEAQSAWRHEFLKDFYWSLNGLESFDSKPNETEKRNDFSVSFSIGWTF